MGDPLATPSHLRVRPPDRYDHKERAMAGPGEWIRARPLLAFAVLAIAITWLSWFPLAAYNRGLWSLYLPWLYFVGGLGPGVAAYVVMRVLRGKKADQELLGPLLRWRVGAGWYVAAVAMFVLVWLAAVSVASELGPELRSLSSAWVVAVALVRSLLAAVPEEVGWRGFALPMLQRRFTALTSSLVVGALWALWHLPLILGGDEVMAGFPLIWYVLWILSESVLYGWLYNNTRGSLLIVVIAHGVSNVVGVFSSAPVATTMITAALAVVVVLRYGPQHLSRTSARMALPAPEPTASGNGATDPDRNLR